MDKNNQNDGFDKLMEKYNFDSPMKVTLVIEEEDPTDLFSSKPLLVPNDTNVPNSNVCSNSTEVYKKSVPNIDNSNNKIPNAMKNCNSVSIVEENNHSITTNETILPKVHQENIPLYLLDTVADNLIHITKCFYYNFIHLKSQAGDKEKLQSEFLTFKHHFFNLSYSTTVAILLPQENNKQFFDNFIHKIMEIAHRSSWYSISYEKLEILIRDMLLWTKQKKKYLDMKLGSHNHESNDIDGSSNKSTDSHNFNYLKHILNGTFKGCSTTNHLKQGISQPDVVPTTHHPVQVMNVSPYITYRNNYSKQESRQNIIPRTNYGIQEIANSTNSSHIINTAQERTTRHDISRNAVQRTNNSNQSVSNQLNFEHKKNNLTEGTNRWPYINRRVNAHEKTTGHDISPKSIQRTNYSNRRISNQLNFEHTTNNSTEGISRLPGIGSRINNSSETNTSNYSNKPKTNNDGSCQEVKTNLNNIFLSTGPPNQKIIISVDPEILANVNQKANQLNNNSTEGRVNDAYPTNTIKRRKTNDSYYQQCNSNSMPQLDKNNERYQNNSCPTATFRSQDGRKDGPNHDNSRNAEIDLFNTDIVRSISRDSGFCSPNYGNSRNEEMIEMVTNKEQETPIISHVTSLNPTAEFLTNGFCTFCGVTTNKMCIGCYQKYYCSPLCQNLDWDIHKYSCR